MIVLWGVMLVVVAAVFFGLWLVAHQRLEKPRITLVEPLFLLTKSWQIARYTGSGSQVEVALRVISATKTGEGDVERILPAVKGKPAQVALLGHRLLPLVGQQQLVEESGKKFSYLIGSVEEAVGQLILTATERQELKRLEESAGQHGFLTIVVGRTAVHADGAKLESLHHIYLGSVLLEPMLDQAAVKQILSLPGDKKLLSVLPPTLAAYLGEKVGLTGSLYAPKVNDSAEKFDQNVMAASLIAQASGETRYRTIRTLQLTHRCLVWSRRESDAQLPARVVTNPTTL